MSSFASVKGPSITVRLLPEYLTRQPLELAFNPEASSSTPAFCSSSWYFCISDMSFSEGITPASESFVALTIIMNRMLFSSVWEPGLRTVPAGCKASLLTVRRTRLCEIDSLNELLLVVDRRCRRGFQEHPAVRAHDDTSFARYSSRRARVWCIPSTAP